MFEESLSIHLQQFNSSPFLFVGSGMSRRYIQMETWESLLSNVCTKLDLGMPFKYYVSNANNQLPLAAKLIGNDFNHIWWTSSTFELSRKAFQDQVQGKYSPLKYEITKYIIEKQNTILPQYQDEIKLLKKAQIDGIITTNWDNLLETFFVDFARFIGQEELIYSELFAIGEIYKIHGCVSKPDSLVLTAEDYDSFHERNPYLAAKLLTIFMEHPIVFLGYSLDDENIQQILKSILKCLKKENIDKLKDRLIFCKYSIEPVQASMADSTILISDTVVPIKLITISDYSELFTVLANIKKKLPIKILRQMKGMIYEFVKSNKPKSKVYVSDNLDNLEDEHNVEFVYGVGLKDRLSDVGLKGIDSRDIFRDAVISKNWPSDKISKTILANASTNGNLPFFKHLEKAGYLDQVGMLPENNDIKELTPAFAKRVNAINETTFHPTGHYKTKEREINDAYSSFSELRAAHNFWHTLVFTSLLEPNKIDVDELATFLKANLDKLIESKYGTHFRKLICLYDYLKYKYPKLPKLNEGV